jgi:hypothetical protein
LASNRSPKDCDEASLQRVYGFFVDDSPFPPNFSYLSCMMVVQTMLARTRSLMRKAAIVIAATQVVLGSAPLFENGARNASAHIEANGVSLHHAHDEATCIGCTANRLLGGAEPVQPALVRPASRIVSTTDQLVEWCSSTGARHKQSRAPPVLLS